MSVVTFENVTKRYTLGQGRGSLRDAAARWAARLARRPIDAEANVLWALKGVDFEVERGETLGLVGVNGAGKSTILKILSGVTRPTSGRVRIDGRLSALIEVGAGFHPDLTGRENIYLNGAILGLSRREIAAQLDSIISFAELAPFIDTPVKRYSSGMFVRLGFSVAIHIDPDILLIDEVLAVGDYLFRDKCVEKIKGFRKSGKTLIVVSHDRNMLEKLCDRAVLLHRGQIMHQGPIRAVLDEYYTGKYRQEERHVSTDVIGQAGDHVGNRVIDILEVRLLDADGRPRSRFLSGESLTIQARFRCNQAVAEPVFYCDIHSQLTWIIGTNTDRSRAVASFEAGQQGTVEMVIQSLNLLSGSYHLDLGAVSHAFAGRPYHIVYKAATFEVSAGREQGDGLVHLPHTWRFAQSNPSSHRATLEAMIEVDR